MNARTIIKRIRHIGFPFQQRLTCDACGRERGDGRRFVSGPSVMICEECVSGIAARSASQHEDAHARAECSFCRDTRPIVGAWPRVRICASCTGLVEKIFAEDNAAR